MPHSSGRRRTPGGAIEGAPGKAGAVAVDAFGRVRETLDRAAEAGSRVGRGEAHERLSDTVRLAGRLRRLEERLGGRRVAELSPYLESLLRLAAGPSIVEPAYLRRAAGF